MNTLPAIHIADNYLINPTNPVTVNLIGAGGTGSQMLTALAKMNYSLVTLGHAGLHVNLFDDDLITEFNQGRQPFSDSEVGCCKSVILINKLNRSIGTNWKAVTKKFESRNVCRLPEQGKANLYISCVDTVAARFDIAKALFQMSGYSRYERNNPLYWMDLGNSQYTGQAILSTITEVKQPPSKLYRTVSILPMVTEEFKDLLEAETDNNEPSCSHAEALEKQDLFINTAVATMGAEILKDLFRNGMTENRGVFINLKELRTTPLKVA